MLVWSKADSSCNLLKERAKYNMIVNKNSSVYYRLNGQYSRNIGDIIKKGIISYKIPYIISLIK